MKVASRSSQNSGFVLLTVVLVSALLIISAAIFTMQLVVESRITNTDAVFKSALSLAETGLNTVMSDIKNNDSAAWAHRLDTGSFNVPVKVIAPMHGTTNVTVRVVPGTKVSGVSDQYTAEIELTSTGAVFPPSVLAAQMATSSDYIARRAVLTRAKATWTSRPGLPATSIPHGHSEPTLVSVGYGVFTGGDFSTQGNASEVNGNIYAAGHATIKKNSVTGGIVYSSGGLDGKPPVGSVGDAPKQDFPYIDTSYYRTLFTAYINGTFPYDTPNNQIPGTGLNPVTNPVRYYTCTNGAWVGNQRDTYNVDALQALTQDWTDPLTLKVYKIIPSANATASLAYMTNSTASYFVSGDLHITAATTLTGALVVDGTIFVNGGANISAGVKMPAIMATGDFVRNNGNATISGLVYTEGTFGGVGTGDIIGALYARGTVDMNGTMKVTYDSSVTAIVTGSTWVDDPPTTTDPVPELFRMDDLTRVAEGGRVWVEVAPGS